MPESSTMSVVRSKLATMLEPFQQRRFGQYMAGETISMIGTWMQIFAQGWVVTSLTQKAENLAWLNVASGIPMMALSLFGGKLADKYDKRYVLYCVLAIQIAAAVGLGLLIAERQIAYWHLLATAVILGFAAAFEMPTTSALVPELVTPDQISNAMAIDRASFHLTRLIGPAVGGWLIGSCGEASAYFLNAGSFLALLAALASIGPRKPGAPAEEAMRGGGIGEGFAYVKGDRPTRSMITLMALMTLFASPFLLVLMPLYSRIILQLPPESMGVLMGVSGVGSFSGALGLLSIPHGRRAFALKIGTALIAVGLTGLSFAPSLLPACFSIICLALGLSGSYGIANIVIQERTPDYLRGRVSAIAGLSFVALGPFSGLAVAWLVDHIGMRHGLLGSGCGFAICAALLLRGVRQLSSAPRSA